MSKLRAIAIAFLVTLLVLFATLIYLMTKINPPEQEPGDLKPNGTAKAEDKFDDADYYLNSNEALLSNDNNLRYGLEKVTGEYDVDAYSKMIAKLKLGPKNTEIPDLLANNETQENCTRIRISKIELATQPVKGFRRSINEKELQENKEYVPIALLMKRKRLDGQPGIQFKLVSDNPKNQRNNSFKSSGNETASINSSSKINFEIDSANSSIKSATIVVAKNGTLVLNIFANAIDLVRKNDTVLYTFVDEDVGNETVSDNPSANIYIENDATLITDSAHLKWQTKIESVMNNTASSNMYTYNLLNNNFTGAIINVTQNSINKTFATQDVGNETVSDNPSANIYIENDATFITDSAHLKWQTEIESSMNNTASPNMYTYNVLNNNFTGAIISVTQNSINKTFATEDAGNETVSDNPSANIYIGNDATFITDSAHLKWQTEIESSMNNTASPNMYTYNVLNNNFTGAIISVTQNSINKTFATEFFAIDNSKNGIITDEIQQETSGSIFREENEVATRKFENESVTVADLEMESTLVTENVDTVFVSDEFNNSSNFVGLLIQESTADLPID